MSFLNKGITVKIANEMDWPPFDYNEFGKAKGLSIEFIKYIFEKIGIKYEFINGYSWAELLKMFKNKQIDIMPAIYKNEKRETYTNFTTPYYQGKLAVFTLKKNNFKNLDDLNNKNVGIQKSDASVGIIKNYIKDSKVVEIETNSELVMQLINNKLDAIVANPKLFHYIIKNNNLPNIYNAMYINLNAKDQQKISLYIGVRKDFKALHSIIQKSLNSFSEDEILKLKKEWQLEKQASKINLTAKEENYLNSKKIKMCVDPDWMPFEKLQDNDYIGIGADIYKLIEKKIGTAITVVPTSTWPESVEYAKKRECDILSLATSTPEREKYMNFTSPYLSIPLVVATKTDIPFISDFDNLKDKKLGIPRGYAFVEIFKKKHPNINLVEVDNIVDGLKRVKNGELFGYIGTLASIGYMFQTQFTGELKIAGKFNETWEIGIAIRNDDKTLFNILQKAVDNISLDEKKEILNKWVAIKYEKGIDYSLVYKIISLALFFLLVILYWNRKLSKLNKELVSAKAKAEEATKVKSNFLANMSHEIRTPMNAIVGMLYMVRQTNLNKTQENYIKNIQSSSNNLLKLLNDILDYSKMEAKKLELNKIDFRLADLIDDVNTIVKIDAYEKGLNYKVSYDMPLDSCLYGDNMKILQVLVNILSNAVKFTEHGSVEFAIEKTSKNRYRFLVKDTGIGIKEEDKERIFSSFTQADSTTTRRYGGTGLGLSICKEIVDMMNGSIWVESVFGKGSLFIFEIELKECENHDGKNEIIIENKNGKIINIDKKKIGDKKSTELFEKLKEAVSKKRPHLCKPLIDELDGYSMDNSKQKLFDDVKKLIEKYQYIEAEELLNG